MDTIQVNIHEAQTQLSELIQAALRVRFLDRRHAP